MATSIIEPLPQDVITIEQMKRLMTQKQANIIPLMPHASIKYIQDPELKHSYDIVNWNLINRLLADNNYTPGKRDVQTVHFFRAELEKISNMWNSATENTNMRSTIPNDKNIQLLSA